MIAAARITNDPAPHGFGDIAPEKPLKYEEIVTDAAMGFAQIAEAAGVDFEQVRLLNAHLKNSRTPGDRRVVVRLPTGAGASFQKNWVRYAGQRQTRAALTRIAQQAAYRVRSGDNLSVVAHRHGVSVAELKRMNGLRSDRIYAGQTLKVTW